MFYRHIKTILCCLLPLAAFALPNDREQPVSISADNATYNEKTGVATYRGNIDIHAVYALQPMS